MPGDFPGAPEDSGAGPGWLDCQVLVTQAPRWLVKGQARNPSDLVPDLVPANPGRCIGVAGGLGGSRRRNPARDHLEDIRALLSLKQL